MGLSVSSEDGLSRQERETELSQRSRRMAELLGKVEDIADEVGYLEYKIFEYAAKTRVLEDAFVVDPAQVEPPELKPTSERFALLRVRHKEVLGKLDIAAKQLNPHFSNLGITMAKDTTPTSWRAMRQTVRALGLPIADRVKQPAAYKLPWE
jgi:uncharacterized protein YjiS (DUF1127 family)